MSSRLLSLLVGIISARLLTQVEFGTFGLIQTTLSSFGILATMSLGIAATRQLAVYRDLSKERAGVAAVVALGLTGVLTLATGMLLLALSPFLAQSTLKNPALAGILRFGILLLGATAVSSTLSGILSGIERFDRSALMAGVQNAAILVCCIAFVPGHRLYGIVGAYVACIAQGKTRSGS